MENLFHVAEQEAKDEREIQSVERTTDTTVSAKDASDASGSRMRNKNRKVFTEELDVLFSNVKYSSNADGSSVRMEIGGDENNKHIIKKSRGIDKMLQPTINLGENINMVIDETSLLSKRRVVLVIDPKKFARLVSLAQAKGTDIKSLASNIIEKFINDVTANEQAAY